MMESRLTEKRIGILGGSFDPPHLGHLSIARDATEHLGLSKVVFVPAAQPPHKQHVRQADAAHRLAMIQQALLPERPFTVSDIELQRGGLSYTVDTVRELRNAYPDAALFLIVGSDTLVELHTWYQIGELLALCSVATVLRPSAAAREEISRKMSISEPHKSELLKNIFNTHPIDISSTGIRQRIAEGKSITNLVPPAVETYINMNNLYQE
jgi:nicotinate-nucleotide adenylyltransferase